jgi:hypothetical protein
MHRVAAAAALANNDGAGLLRQVAGIDRQRYNLINSIYFFVRENVAVDKMPRILSFQSKVLDVPLPHKHGHLQLFSSPVARGFTVAAAVIYRKQIILKMKASPFFSISADESDNKAHASTMAITGLYLDANGAVKSAFLGLMHVTDRTADGLKMLLMTKIDTEFQLDFQKWVGFGTDGASVMTGKENGVAVKVKLHCAYLMSIH